MKRLLQLVYWSLTFRLGRRLREERAFPRIEASGLFDVDHYLLCNPDLAGISQAPLAHYLHHGGEEGRDPNPFFASAWYLESNPDVARRRRNPLDHWLSEGLAEERLPHPDFDLAAWRLEGTGDRPPSLEQLAFFVMGPIEHEPKPEPEPEPEPEEIVEDVVEEVIDYLPIDSFVGAPIEVGPTIRLEVTRLDTRATAAGHTDDPIVVVVGHVLAYPPRAGNEIRIQRYVRWLEARGHQVLSVVCPLGGEEKSEEALAVASEGLSNLVYCERGGRVVTAVQPHLAHLVEGLDGLGVWPLSRNEQQQCAHDLPFSESAAHAEETYCPDALIRVLLHIDGRLPERAAYITNYVVNTRFLPLLGEGRLRLLDTHDVFSSKAEKLGAFGIDAQSPVGAAEERALLLRADVVMAIQGDEALQLRALAPEREVIEVGIDFDPAAPGAAHLPGRERPPSVLFLASDNPMNVRGLHDFLELVWPSVCRDHPDAVLQVAGTISPHVPEEAAQTRVLGAVDSVDDAYLGCHLVINPVAAGTGLKIKTLEALVHWRPLVTWPAGVDGVARELRRHCDVAEDLYTFYLFVTKRLSERRDVVMDAAARREIEACLSPHRVYSALDEVLARSFRPAR